MNLPSSSIAVRTIGLAGAAAVLTGVAACGTTSSPTPSGGSSASSDATGSSSPAGVASTSHAVIQVVASTNVWGQVAKEVGGDHVTVTSFISDPSQDPHSYEASTQNQLAVKNSGLVIENGGGYDDFMDTMLKASGSNPPLVNAVQVSGKTADAGGELNEHVWYDLPTVAKVADQIASQLGTVDPTAKAEFTKNANTFAQSLQPLTAAVGQIKTAKAGTGVAITEAVPGYLLEAAGLVNKTPAEFSKAVEEGSDVSPAVLNDTVKLFTGNQVAALVYNEQTTGAPTEAVKAAATKAGIPVVPVTETLPDNASYTQWMSSQITALAKALGVNA